MSAATKALHLGEPERLVMLRGNALDNESTGYAPAPSIKPAASQFRLPRAVFDEAGRTVYPEHREVSANLALS